jgi:putative inorganic carbon (HCO3(-)) transporter
LSRAQLIEGSPSVRQPLGLVYAAATACWSRLTLQIKNRLHLNYLASALGSRDLNERGLSLNFARKALLFMLFIRAGADGLFGLARFEEGGFTPGAILNLAAIGLFVVCLAATRGANLKIPALIWSPYLLIAAASLAYTPDFFGGVRLFMSTLTFPAIFGAMFMLIRTEAQFASLIRTILLSSLIPSAVAIYQLATDGPDERLQSTLGHPNIFAFYIVAILVCILYYQQIARIPLFDRLFLAGYAALQLLFLLFTQTRSAWGAAVVLMAVYAVGIDRRLLLAIPLIPMILLLPPVADRLSDVDLGQSASYEDVQKGRVVLNSYAWREKLWTSALDDASDNRIFGKGLNSFHHNSPYFFPLFTQGGARDAHSGYVQAIYETGWLGLLTYIWIYVGVTLTALRRHRGRARESWLIYAFVAVNLMINYADNIPYYLPYNWYVWAFFGAGLASRYSRWQSRDVVLPLIPASVARSV